MHLLSLQLIKALVPSDPLDSSNILLEVVSGRTTGGKKACKPIFPQVSSHINFFCREVSSGMIENRRATFEISNTVVLTVLTATVHLYLRYILNVS